MEEPLFQGGVSEALARNGERVNPSPGPQPRLTREACTELKPAETPRPQVGSSGDGVADEAGAQERVARSVFRVMRSMHFSPEGGVFIMSVWVTDSGRATWTGGAHSWPASVERSPGHRVSGASPSGHRCRYVRRRTPSRRDSRDSRSGGGRAVPAGSQLTCSLSACQPDAG